MKSKERIKQTGEIFTPLPLVDEILNKLPEEVWTDHTKTFLDPACGDGNFLVRVLHFKLTHHPTKILESISTIYGVELMEDNVELARDRLFTVLYEYAESTNQLNVVIDNQDLIWDILSEHIVFENSLTYDFSFNFNPNK